MIKLYKVKLDGNYNIFISDLNVEFTPINSVHMFSDDEFESSNDIKAFLGEYLTHHKLDNKEGKHVAKETKTPVKHEDIVVIDSKNKTTEVEKEIVNATDASKNASYENKQRPQKTLTEEKKGKDENVFDANGASKTESDSKVVKSAETTKDQEVIDASGAASRSASDTTTKVEVAVADNKSNKKAGSPKKNK